MSVEIPEGSGYVVSMVEHKGAIIIACQFAVYRVLGKDKLETILQVPHPPIVLDRKDLE